MTEQSETLHKPHPNAAINRPDFPPRVYFNDLNPDSLNILLIYWYHPPDYWDYLEHAHWVNVQILERFNTEGIDFAFPSQTLYHAGDEKRPLTIGQQWASNADTHSQETVPKTESPFDTKTAQANPSRDSSRTDLKASEELTDAPIEDELLQNDEGQSN